jgi:hypothetical protein
MEGSRTRTCSSPGWLDDIGVRHESALSSRGRDSLRAWERVLARLRDESFDLLHLGVDDGASLRTWREAFPEARLVGLDARRLVLDPPIANCIVQQGKPTDLYVVKPLLREYRFRLIVDDGSHHAEDQVQTFLTLFPWMEPDSIYICAGLDEIWTRPLPQQRPKKASRKSTHGAQPPKNSKRQTGLAWFADFGRALTDCEHQNGKTLDQTMRNLALQRASGVLLLRGSVVVTS